MKTLTTILALATFVAAPAFAQAPYASTNTVTLGGKYVGQDPDAAIRNQLIRDYSVHAGGGE
jgi:hypothetical protein